MSAESTLKVFENAEFGQIRLTVKEGEPWFCLQDVCNALDIGTTANVKSRLDEKGVDSINTLTKGGMQALTFVDEPNLYRAIFQSRKPEAKRFQDWIFTEVLPSIRKHGLYAKEELLDNPDLLVEVALKLKTERDARLALEAKNAEQAQQLEEAKPKVLFANAVSTSDTCILIGELAKLLKGNGIEIGQNRLFDWLRENGYLIKRKGTDYNAPTQKAMELGLFKVNESTVTNSNGKIIITRTTKVTGKGQQYFINAFLSEAEDIVS